MERVMAIVGRSKIGKTTLMVKLIAELTARGVRVATMKHTRHHFETDQPGKDSYKHFEAGAAASGVFSDEKLAVVKRLDKPVAVREIISQYLAGHDLVLIEGLKSDDLPKIEILGPKGGEGPVCDVKKDGVVASVTRGDAAPEGVPVFKASQVGEIVDFIVKKFVRNARRRK
jgi:molybdopterin-guanine dinucleotide biosynthesis protein B